MRVREFKYRNDLGEWKNLKVYPDIVNEEGEVAYAIWSMGNGELCSAGHATHEQIFDLLKNYGITY